MCGGGGKVSPIVFTGMAFFLDMTWAFVADIETGRADSGMGWTTASSARLLAFSGEFCKLVGAVDGEAAGDDTVDGVVEAVIVAGFCKLENNGPCWDMTVKQTF